MAELAETEVAHSDALFAAPAKSGPVPFIGPEAEPSSEHRAPAAAVVARHAQQGYGNASTFRLVSRLRVQRKAVVSSPGDSFEREAEAVATSVVSGGSTPSISPISGASVAREAAYEEPKKPPPVVEPKKRVEETAEPVQAAGGGEVTPEVNDAASAAISNPGPGVPMHPATRATLETRLDTDLGDVRVHEDDAAHRHADAVQARAFTHGSDIWLGRSESQSDLALMAHETTHVVQQRGGATPVQRKPFIQRSVRDLIPDWVLDALAEGARSIPGWTLFTVIIAFNPITGRDVPRSAVNVLEGLISLVPLYGPIIFDTLRERGIIDAAAAWIEGQMSRLDLSLNRLERTIEGAIADLSWTGGIDYNVGVLRRHLGGLYNDVVAFAESLVNQIIQMIKDAVVGVAESLLAENRAWALIKKILGHDPLRDVAVTATHTEILEDFLILIGKQQHLDKMREQGTVEETANWLATQIATFMSLLGELRGLIARAWDAIQPANLPNLMNDLNVLATDAGAFLQRVWDFAATVAVKVLEFIKRALLEWLSNFAHESRGFPLITVILGRDPFTGEVVPRTAQNIIRGFITLLPGGAEIYAKLEETGIVTNAAARIEGAMESLGISWAFIVGLFTGIWNSLSIEDLLNPIGAFIRIIDTFGEPISRLVQFVGVVLREMIFLILQLMNFPFDLIGSIVTNAMQAIEDIKRDPVAFLLNMLGALKLGFTKFFDNIVTHLIGGLADWLFRGLRSAGISPPTDLTFASVLDFVLQVLGISMEKIWEKLGNRIGQETVARIRGVIDRLVGIWSFIKDVQERGVVAIWEYVESQLSNLWNMVLDKAKEWIMERVIARAVQWLLSLLDITGIMPVINSCVAFFRAAQSAIEYLRDILMIIDDYVSTVAAVARGELEPGAAKIEHGLASAIPIAIGFLANILGLGNIGEKIQEIVAGLRGLVDRALDWLIDRAVSAMESLMSALGFGGEEEEEVDPSDHAAFAQHAVETLESAALTGDDRIAAARAFAAEQEPVLSAQLADGIHLRFVFSDSPDEMADGDVDFSVVIEPNTTTAAGTLPPDPNFPLQTTPGIGDIARHGWQERRVREPPTIAMTESEHILPFATGRTMWQALEMYLPERGWREDNQQTTLVIYYGAARIKTPVDNEISAAFGAEAANLNLSLRFQVLVDQYEHGDETALSRADDVLDLIAVPLDRARADAVERTVAAIEEDHAATEAGFTQTNGQRRAETSALPPEGRVTQAAAAQFEDLMHLVRDSVLDHDELIEKMDRILGRN
jgi:hypothetical protein